MPSVGIDRYTGRVLTDLDHVRQSVSTLFSTRLGARVMRRFYGFVGLALLGRANLTPTELLRFTAAIHLAIELWEPRLDSLRVTYPDRDNGTDKARQGKVGMVMRARYYPHALQGDRTSDVVDIDF